VTVIAAGVLVAWPAGGALAQLSPRAVAVSPFAGVEFRGGQNPLFGIGATFSLPSDVALLVTASAIRYTGVYQLEAGIRWPALRDTPVTPYAGAALCLLRWPSADQVTGGSWRAGGLAVAGLEARALGGMVFTEGLAVTDGTWAFQVRGGLRIVTP
jgi:hypothetical protein